MATKKKVEKAPARTAGARPNKQRITKITRREIDAHEATGGVWGPGIVPRDETLRVLSTYGIVGEIAEAIIDDSVDPLGRFRMDENYRKKRLTPAEMARQARDTSAVAEELEKRIRNMDPHIRAYAVGKAYTAWGEAAFPESLEPPLTRLAVLLKLVAAMIDTFPSKVPKRTGPRDELLSEVVGILGRRVTKVSKAVQRQIAVDLVSVWGAPVPASDYKIRKAVRGRGTK